jgi:probable phosphoglycerate mutase
VPAVESTTILLVRHARTPTTGKVLPGRAPGLHLSPAGQREASAVAQRLGELSPPPEAVITSPLERARETAAPIAKALGVKASVDRGLLECDFGEWTGRRLAQLRRRREWRAVLGAPSSFRFPQGESFAEMQVRVWTAIERIAENHRGRRVVVVSHADPIKAALAVALGIPLDLFQRVVVGTASVSALVVSPHGSVVLGMNHVGSLADWGLS